MASIAQRRSARLRVDQGIARASTPMIRRALRIEGRAVAAAVKGASTPAEWERAARGAISDSLWVKTLVALWLSPPMYRVWDAQQKILGTDFDMPKDVVKILTGYATDHGKATADRRRDRMTRLVSNNTKADPDPIAATRVFRSTMRVALREEYAAVATDTAARIAWSETLQATESVRYESSRVSVTRTKDRIRKVWFTMSDNRVRDSHQKVNGRSRFVDHRGWGGRPGKFRVGGDMLRYPRDPQGSAGETINCRCFLEYRKVRARPAA